MTTKADKPLSIDKKKKCTHSKFESLLQTCSNATEASEPAQFNNFENTRNYLVYFNKLAKKSNDNGY